MEYKLIITQNFKDDLDSILEYISQQLFNSSAADRLMKKAEEKVRSIKENPFLYPIYHDEILAGKGYRYTVVSNYILFYTVDQENKIVSVLRLIYGGQNILNILNT
ncbi:MAG: type II toxin-antitoxin system RelE/ParE family toxin [Oscillospiraceae bacterium]|nr:type II toxin-antitoxin system RelE/ParE family toxin [Oscillospiraceae bacterium]